MMVINFNLQDIFPDDLPTAHLMVGSRLYSNNKYVAHAVTGRLYLENFVFKKKERTCSDACQLQPRLCLSTFLSRCTTSEYDALETVSH